MTPAALAKLRDRANAAILSGFETELVLGRSRSTARKLANAVAHRTLEAERRKWSGAA